jgi:hypothetical protein
VTKLSVCVFRAPFNDLKFRQSPRIRWSKEPPDNPNATEIQTLSFIPFTLRKVALLSYNYRLIFASTFVSVFFRGTCSSFNLAESVVITLEIVVSESPQL